MYTVYTNTIKGQHQTHNSTQAKRQPQIITNKQITKTKQHQNHNKPTK